MKKKKHERVFSGVLGEEKKEERRTDFFFCVGALIFGKKNCILNFIFVFSPLVASVLTISLSQVYKRPPPSSRQIFLFL